MISIWVTVTPNKSMEKKIENEMNKKQKEKHDGKTTLTSSTTTTLVLKRTTFSVVY